MERNKHLEDLKLKIKDLHSEIETEEDKDKQIAMYKDLTSSLAQACQMIYIDFYILKEADEKKKEYTKQYYHSHKDKIKTKSKDHYKKLKESFDEKNNIN